MEEGIFQKIIRGAIPCHKIFEDEHTFAFLDIAPVTPGHTLVVPKTRFENIFDIPEGEWLALMKTVHFLAPRIHEALGAAGMNIGMNNGPAAGQAVPHAHVHIMPRFSGDGLALWHGRAYAEGEAEEVAGNIRKTIGG